MVALERWPADGIPDNPGAWITRVARNKAIDRVRREQNLAGKLTILERLEQLRGPGEPGPEQAALEAEGIPDDRLRLIFTCAHPAIAIEARVALTLKLLGGLTTAEVARAFLVQESAMAQRIVRAKRKIAGAGIAYEVPEAKRLPERLPAVLATLYLIFNEGYLAHAGEAPIRRELCEEAIRLARVLAGLMPRQPEVLGLLALMLLTDARRPARLDAAGELVRLEDQDRSLWDREAITEGLALSAAAAAHGPAGPYTIQSRIAAAHAASAQTGQTDWPKIARLYAWLARFAPGPVVELNRAAAIAMAEGPEAGLARMDQIEGLDDYHPYHAARADLLERLGRRDEAEGAYRRALELATNPGERRLLERRLAGI